MLEVNYEIEFFSSWHCGSGQGGGRDADYCPIRDEEGFPFVPGKTIKGLFRDAAETLFDAAFTARIFGMASRRDAGETRSGQAIWSDARLEAAVRREILKRKSESELYVNQYFIKLDEQGQAEDQALRHGEYAVPVKLYGKIENLDEADIEKIRECAGFIKHIGLQRSRGFGRCRISILGNGSRSVKVDFTFERKDVYSFKCKFLTPVILNATSATEGNLDTLEYVPGSNFLGIVGRDYAAFGEDAFTVFHSGKVRFGNAYPLENGQTALPCPATWFIPKGQGLVAGTEIFPDSESRAAKQAELQPKQVRGGYFIPASNPRVWCGQVSKTFSLKSAYDSEKRKTRDKEMFGYTALNGGTEWTFNVKIDPSVSDDTAKKIVTMLLGRHQIGRSKSSQYGSVEISLLVADPLQTISQKQMAESYYLYALSSLAFLDSYGEPALLPQLEDLGFAEDAEFVMEETQIRYHAYSPWNGARKTRDAERLVILPGSVIVVHSANPPDPDILKNGVGIFRSEGFGEVLCNPAFLFCKSLAEGENRKVVPSACEDSATKDDTLLAWLNMQKTNREMVCKIYNAVQKFDAGRFPRVSASQWGAVRAYAAESENVVELCKQLFEEKEVAEKQPSYEDIIKNGKNVHIKHPGYLRHGTAVKQWKKEAVDQLEQKINEVKKIYGDHFALIFVQLLCAEMAKRARAKKGVR